MNISIECWPAASAILSWQTTIHKGGGEEDQYHRRKKNHNMFMSGHKDPSLASFPFCAYCFTLGSKDLYNRSDTIFLASCALPPCRTTKALGTKITSRSIAYGPRSCKNLSMTPLKWWSHCWIKDKAQISQKTCRWNNLLGSTLRKYKTSNYAKACWTHVWLEMWGLRFEKSLL